MEKIKTLEVLTMGVIGNVGNENMQSCIDICVKCTQACEECLTLCLKEQDVAARIKCIQTLQDCIDICCLSAKYMIRNSEHAKHICKECAEICKVCAKECEMFKDEHCQKCAEICRQCAQECMKMSK